MQLIQCGLNMIKSKLSLSQRAFLDKLVAMQGKRLMAVKAEMQAKMAQANED